MGHQVAKTWPTLVLALLRLSHKSTRTVWRSAETLVTVSIVSEISDPNFLQDRCSNQHEAVSLLPNRISSASDICICAGFHWCPLKSVIQIILGFVPVGPWWVPVFSPTTDDRRGRHPTFSSQGEIAKRTVVFGWSVLTAARKIRRFRIVSV